MVTYFLVLARFLEGLTPPIKVDEAKVQRWHPKFRLEEIPDVAVAQLPAAPEVGLRAFFSAPSFPSEGIVFLVFDNLNK